MGSYGLWISLVTLLLWAVSAGAEKVVKQAKLDPGTVKMLSNILDSLDAFRNDRLRDLEKIRLATPEKNATLARSDAGEYLALQNSSVSEHIKALKEGIMGHNPVKKTFGYKVTVYTSPIEDDGKDGKPIVVTQYVGGDMKPDAPPIKKRKGEVEDLQESANQPDKQLVQSSESLHLPIKVNVEDGHGAGESHETASTGGAKDHNRKTEHVSSSEKGHQTGHKAHSSLVKGHDHEKHSDKHGEHHKETETESHRQDTQAHDKGGATQQGIRERTEIEYYEREHFLDTEYDKAKSGHDNTKGLKEHESHNDHDSHEQKRLHAKENANAHLTKAGDKAVNSNAESVADGYVRPADYSPPYGIHYKAKPLDIHEDKHHHEVDSHVHKEGSGALKLHHSEESKGHTEHNHKRDHHSEEKDKGYIDKDKGRRKEGYRERGYKITAEREYFLNDAHHDTGHSTHKSGSRTKDQEGEKHGAKEGERDRGFTKEHKSEEAHDAAYDAKDQKYFDGEQHSEDYKSKTSSSVAKEKHQQQEEVVPLAPPGVNYLEERPLPLPLYPIPVGHAPSNGEIQSGVIFPPKQLPLQRIHPNLPPPPLKRNRPIIPAGGATFPRKHQPIGGYDDEGEEEEVEEKKPQEYVGHARFRKRPAHALITNIRDNVRKDVHAEPPSYSKSQSTSKSQSSSSEENAVRFPDGAKSDKSDEDSSEVEQNSEEAEYANDPQRNYAYAAKRNRPSEERYEYPKKSKTPQTRESQRYPSRQEKRYPEDSKRYKPEDSSNPPSRPYNNNNREQHQQRYPKDTVKVYPTPNKNGPNGGHGGHGDYPQEKDERQPTIGELIEDVLRFQPEPLRQPYPSRPLNNRNQLPPSNVQRYYPQTPETYRQKPIQVTFVQQPQPQPIPIAVTPLDQIRLQTKPPFSPVVLLSRGPPPQAQSVDVWYTRPRN